ncbi:MAG TPA: hypothetical protein VGH51_17855 [Candidatus Angelobacter sp.]|jgi:hypothetical protein
MGFRLKASFTTISTAILLSAAALLVSVIAFAVLYADSDSFWAVLWLGVILPIIWAAAIVLGIIDALKRRSWRQIAGVVALLAPTALLVNTMLSPRFAFHQLFTFRALDLNLPTNGFALIQKFTVCGQDAPCKPHSVVTDTRNFKLTKIPEGCCSLVVVNGRGDKHMVEAFRVALNGKEVRLPVGGPVQSAPVELSTDNEISVQMRGASDAYMYVLVSYTGKKRAPPS